MNVNMRKERGMPIGEQSYTCENCGDTSVSFVFSEDAKALERDLARLTEENEALRKEAKSLSQGYLDLAKQHAEELYEKGGMRNQLIANAIWHMHDACAATEPKDKP